MWCQATVAASMPEHTDRYFTAGLPCRAGDSGSLHETLCPGPGRVLVDHPVMVRAAGHPGGHSQVKPATAFHVVHLVGWLGALRHLALRVQGQELGTLAAVRNHIHAPLFRDSADWGTPKWDCRPGERLAALDHGRTFWISQCSEPLPGPWPRLRLTR